MENLEVDIPIDLTQYTEKPIAGFTTRQFVAIVGAVICGVLIGCIGYGIFHIRVNSLAPVIAGQAVAWGLLGFFKKKGTDIYLIDYYRQKLTYTNKKLVYDSRIAYFKMYSEWQRNLYLEEKNKKVKTKKQEESHERAGIYSFGVQKSDEIRYRKAWKMARKDCRSAYRASRKGRRKKKVA